MYTGERRLVQQALHGTHRALHVCAAAELPSVRLRGSGLHSVDVDAAGTRNGVRQSRAANYCHEEAPRAQPNSDRHTIRTNVDAAADLLSRCHISTGASIRQRQGKIGRVI